ncbi:MAG TPA: hypothetical protein ENI79_05935 [Rhodospirillales bacterium]|mgnify:CR=1 FL=1|nr:hypothetical protein [Rhodospirillales bacterium]
MAAFFSQLVKRQHINSFFDRFFPERQLHLRTDGQVSFFRFTQRAQIFCLTLFIAGFGWTIYTTTSFILYGKIVSDKDIQIANARLAYKSLLGEVSQYQNKFASIKDDLEENQTLMLGLVERNTSLQQKFLSINSKLSATKNDRQKFIAARENLKKQLNSTRTEIQSTSNSNQELKDKLKSMQTDLQLALSERNQAKSKSKKMALNINNLNEKLVNLQKSEYEAVQRLTNGTVSFIESMQKVVKMTGLHVDKLLKADGVGPIGQGGPFIAAKPDDLPGGRLKSDLVILDGFLQHSEALQEVMSKLPLSPPLNKYRITSAFGKRRDPIINKWAAHYGIDLGDTNKAPVYSTAPGVVTFAGWKGNYGKYIEVDHGAGLKTRFGHLNKIFVKKGQKVKFRDKIGLLGSTGRSTGAHLHYEIVFRGKARNPIKFIKAGRYVFQK